MISELICTLRTDGSSDTVLIPILKWLLVEKGVSCPIDIQYAERWQLPKTKTLAQEIEVILDLYPCDLLFIHRDAEKEPMQNRIDEINRAVSKVSDKFVSPPIICVIPVKMQEAWLLFNELAIRNAASNPNGKQHLDLPKISQLEALPDPKETLHALLREASNLRSGRRKKFNADASAHLIPNYIDDFSPLMTLPAFSALAQRVEEMIKSHFQLQ
jgi:hypothetical protein